MPLLMLPTNVTVTHARNHLHKLLETVAGWKVQQVYEDIQRLGLRGEIAKCNSCIVARWLAYYLPNATVDVVTGRASITHWHLREVLEERVPMPRVLSEVVFLFDHWHLPEFAATPRQPANITLHRTSETLERLYGAWRPPHAAISCATQNTPQIANATDGY